MMYKETMRSNVCSKKLEMQSAQKSMVDTIQKTILSKDNAQPLLTKSVEERNQKVIATQQQKSNPAIVEATVNHLMSNKFIDKTISRTIGTTVSKIMGNESTKDTNENPAMEKAQQKK
eukprot:14384475-Ditylum_brightwellii.AAC.1